MSYKKSAERRDQILDCAKKLFAEKGFQSAQIAEICDELHIARGTVYQYFENKEDIFKTLIVEYFDEINKALDSTDLDVETISGAMPPFEILKQMLIESTHAFFRHMYSDRDIGRIIIFDGHAQMPGMSGIVRGFFEARRQKIVVALSLGMAMGLLRKIDPELLASAMQGSATRTVVDFIIGGRITDEAQLRPMAEELINFQLHGVVADGVDRD